MADTLRMPMALHLCGVTRGSTGARNWIDTCGVHDVLMLYRWQGLPERPVLTGQQIRLSRLVEAE